MKLIVGLGNPGKKYENTRHNFGFMLADELARAKGFDFTSSLKFQGEFAELRDKVHDKIFFLKPTTFMNLSGEAVLPVMQFYKIAPEDVLVIHDDLDLPLGSMRLARKGSPGGHNGLKSIIQNLGTQEFCRLRLGIGRPKFVGQEVVDFVLQKFSKDERPLVDEVLADSCKAITTFLEHGIQMAMNEWN